MAQSARAGPRAQPAHAPDHLVGAAVLALLILTAWGNATAVLTVAAFGLAVGAVVFRRSLTVTVVLTMLLTAVLAALVAVM
jgi:hypothetical protein